jgi:hypothetical protein
VADVFHCVNETRKGEVEPRRRKTIPRFNAIDADEQMQVIGHIIDRNQLLLLSRDNSGNVFLKFVVMLRLDKILSALDGENNMKIDLPVRVCHELKMPLLPELENLF